MALTWRNGVNGPVNRPLDEATGNLPAASHPAGAGTAAGAGAVVREGSAGLHAAGADTGQAHLRGLTWRNGVNGPVNRPLAMQGGAFAPASQPAGAGTIAGNAQVIAHGADSLHGAGAVAAAGLSVPPQGFALAIAIGDLAGGGLAVAPAGWTPLHTVTAQNGTDHAADVVLAAAVSVVTTAVTVTATSSATQDIAGAVTGVMVGAASPVPAGQRPGWPYVKWEAAFGSGILTPPDQRVWTDLQTDANGRRCRSWQEETGVQFESGSLESSEVSWVLDNPDGFLSADNPASPWFPFVEPGTPVRLRAVPPPSTGVQAWQVIERPAESWPESWDASLRGKSEAAGTDVWSVANRSLRSPYRAEIAAHAPYAWWPCDDQAALGGVAPVSLRNAAAGNTRPLLINASPNGTFFLNSLFEQGYLALSQVAQDSGWMYGDPSSQAGPGGPGGPVTAQPGAFSWRHTGNGGLTTGFYLACNDPAFPPISGGVTTEGWWNYEFANLDAAQSTGKIPPRQPVTGTPPAIGNIVIWEMATATAPVAVLYLDTSGHLQFTASGTTTAIYTGADLRRNTWMHIAVTVAPGAWTVYLNGGATAKVTGSASFASAWSWLIFGASMGAGGGGSTSGITGLGNAAHSDLKVFPRVLPASQIVSHYMAAATGFGLVPAPSSPSAQYVAAGSVLPNGAPAAGGYGKTAPSSMALTVTSVLGGLTSGAAAENASVNQNTAGSLTGGDYYLTWGGVAPSYSVYTAAQTRAEKLFGSTGAQWSDQTGGTYPSGASPPAAPTPTGDTVQARLERLLASGTLAVPRCIDPATALVQAALDTGGATAGTAFSNITSSDGGWPFIDNAGALCYWSRPHLAAGQVTWQLGPNVAAGQIPWQNDDAELSSDPQRVRNNVVVTPYAPDGSSLPLITPADTATAAASQQQYGEQDLALTSYLQSQALQQAQADWQLANFAVARKRAVSITVNAAGMTDSVPQAWLYVLGANIADLVQLTVAQPGQPTFTFVLRISHITRKIDFAAGEASLTAALDYEPASYWGV